MRRCRALALVLVAGTAVAQCPGAGFRDPEPLASAAPAQAAPLAPVPAPFPAMRSPILLPFNASERVYLPIQQAVSDEELTARADCPHLAAGLQNWHDPATWPDGVVPSTSGMDVTLPPYSHVLISSCSIPADVIFGYIHVPETTSLVFAVRYHENATCIYRRMIRCSSVISPLLKQRPHATGSVKAINLAYAQRVAARLRGLPLASPLRAPLVCRTPTSRSTPTASWCTLMRAC